MAISYASGTVCAPAAEVRHAPLTVGVARTSLDLRAIFRFRYEIYIREMGKVLAAADHQHCLLREPSDEHATLLFVRDHGQICGTMRLQLGCASSAQLARLGADRIPGSSERFGVVSKTMVQAGLRGTQAFALLAQRAYREFLAAGMTHVLLHCRPALVRLYERLGFVRSGADFHDAEVGPQVGMWIDGAAATAILRRNSNSVTAA